MASKASIMTNKQNKTWKLKPKISTEDSNSPTEQKEQNKHPTQTNALHLLSPSLDNTKSIITKHEFVGSKFKFSTEPPNELDEIINHTNDSITQFKINHSNNINQSSMQSFNTIIDHNNRKNNNKKLEFPRSNFTCDPNITFTSDINKQLTTLEIEDNVSSIQIQSGYPLTKQELLNNFKMLLKDGGIKKKIIKPSNASIPPKHSTIYIHYTATLPYLNNKKFCSTRDKGKLYKFKFGQSKLIKVLDIGVASMKKGERCILRCVSKYAYGDHGKSSLNVPPRAICDFDVELIDYDDWKECTGDASGRMEKKILINNKSDDAICIEKDTEVNISYKIYYKDKDKQCILCSRDNMNGIIVDDDYRFTNAFHMALKTMISGEKALFKIKDKTLINVNDIFVDENELKDNELNHNKRVCPNGKDTIYEIYIHDAVESCPMDEYEFEERIEIGLNNKNKGNELFKYNLYNAAIKKYDKALKWIGFEFENDEIEENDDNELENEKDELYIDINNNLTLIYVKMNKWIDAIKYASDVLEKDCDNVKALMRRGQARLEESHFEDSKQDLKYALTLDKNNNVIKKLLKKCNIKQKEYNEKQKKLYGGMYAKKCENKCKKIDEISGVNSESKINIGTGNESKDNMKQKNEFIELKCEYDLMRNKYDNLYVKYESKKEIIKELENDKNEKVKCINELELEMEKQEEEHKQEIANMINIKISYKKMKRKYYELKNKNESNLLREYMLKKKLKKQQKKFGYKTWDCVDVVNWIIGLDNGKYEKYYHVLLQRLVNERIDGECLGDLDKNDLHRLGITCFKDKFCIYNTIQELVKEKHEEIKECVVCMDDDPRIACLPCGHLCVCEKCKKLIDGSCPVCQRKCVSFVKIYT